MIFYLIFRQQTLFFLSEIVFLKNVSLGHVLASLQSMRLRGLDPILYTGKTPQASKPEIQTLLYSRIRAILFYFSVEVWAKIPDFKN